MAKDLYIPVSIRGGRLEAKAQLGQTVIIKEGPETYTGPVTVTPAKEQQTLLTADKLLTDNVTVKPIPPEYIIPIGKIEITENGQYDVTEKASVSVDVPAPAYKVEHGSFISNGEYLEIKIPASFMPDYLIMYSPTQLDGYTPASGAIWYLALINQLTCICARKTSNGGLSSTGMWTLPRPNNNPGLDYEDGVLTLILPGSTAYTLAENQTYNYVLVKLSE